MRIIHGQAFWVGLGMFLGRAGEEGKRQAPCSRETVRRAVVILEDAARSRFETTLF
jgi:hypothetical protein